MAEVFSPENTDQPWAEDYDNVLALLTKISATIFSSTNTGGLTATFSPSDRFATELMAEIVEGNPIALMIADMRDYSLGEPERSKGDRLHRTLRSIEKKYEQAWKPIYFNA